MMYIEMRLLHMAVELNNIADIRQSIYMMIDTTEKTKNKEDIDYIINQLKGLESKYGNELFDNTFKNKLKIRFGRLVLSLITRSSSSIILKYDSFALSMRLFDSSKGSFISLKYFFLIEIALIRNLIIFISES